MSGYRTRYKRNNTNTTTNTTKSRHTHPVTTTTNSQPQPRLHRLDDIERANKVDMFDEKVGFGRYQGKEAKLGWLVNMQETLLADADHPNGRSGVDLYFITEGEGTFKTTFFYQPYFHLLTKPFAQNEVEEQLRRKFPDQIERIERLTKEDLSLPNHLGGAQQNVMKLSFRNTSDLLTVRKFLLPLANNHSKDNHARHAYADMLHSIKGHHNDTETNVWENLVGIREYDVPYLCRTAIDIDLRVGLWYTVQPSSDSHNDLIISHRADLVHRADPVILAFDIETTKLPLKFPDSSFDMIMMISYMVDGEGYLITNRDIIAADIEDFEYSPKPDMEGFFTIFNEPNEKALLARFFSHIRELKPTVIVTYNGDFFDWPFVDTRAKFHGLDIENEIGFFKDDQAEYKSSYCIHMDCLAWVKRDSYLPAGSHGLKAVSTSKLGYHPVELDPELMMQSARDDPHRLAQYSVSDAAATYYLYMKYVHPFIFSLCNIIPACPDDVLRKGSGTLCEYLLMVEAYRANVLMPNKTTESSGKMFNGHMLESETYVGGHVEALEAGVFRKDIPVPFHVQSDGIDTLIEQLHDALQFSIQVEGKIDLDQVENYDQVYNQIKSSLEGLRSNVPVMLTPLIYHLDVAAMYPNIILTNRLQPDAIIEESTCASCDFNRPGKTCDRKMTWSWRGEYFPAKQGDINMLRHQLTSEVFPGRNPNDPPRPFPSLSPAEQHEQLKKRLSQYCRKVFSKVHETKVVEKTSIVCQRENPFYIDTVRSFRDRRYEYKGLHKHWKGVLDQAIQEGDATQIEEAKRLIIVFDSLQLAHKCILNSFYGYVMRKGSRWYSMEMGGIVCLTGAKIIQMARQMVEKVGRPLELDTDGIWCILPNTFPENFTFQLKSGKKFGISYPCTMLNHLVHASFTNHQYQVLTDPASRRYAVQSENSIFFEVDGPYRAMILPASKEADKLLKKRYAVFNDDGSLAELKGFEVKRRGELKLIKIFQTLIFPAFLQGTTLKECYGAVAQEANRWLDILFTKGANLQDAELFELIAENRSMSRALVDYGEQKSTSISTAKRLAEFLGEAMVKDKGLACQFIVSRLPSELPVSERAIPIAIFSAELAVKNHYLRKWTRDSSLDDPDIRSILDWSYYIERFGSVIQKLITIPAAMQRIPNPVPRVPHPDWLAKRIATRDDRFQQRRITDIFRVEKRKVKSIDDIEDFADPSAVGKGVQPVVAKVTKKRASTAEEMLAEHLSQDRPSLEGPYHVWIAFQIKKWRLQRQVRAQKHRPKPVSSVATNEQATITRVTGRVSNLLRNSMPYLFQPFHILQVTPTDQPGLLKMWILVGAQMFAIKLVVPRTFFVNSKIAETVDPANLPPGSEFVMETSKHRLPRSFKSLFLQRLQMNESFYLANQEDFTALFCHHNIEGAYETQIEPITRALIDLGCIASLQGEFDLAHPPQQFHLDQFYRESIERAPYLNGGGSLNYLVLVHEWQGSRHMIMVYSSVQRLAHVLVIDGPHKPQPQLPNLTNLYKRYYDQRQPSNLPVIQPDVRFESQFLDHSDLGWGVIQKLLVQYQAQKFGPTLLVVCSPLENQVLMRARAMQEFPSVVIPASGSVSFLTLGWQQQIVNLLMGRLLGVSGWLSEQISWANYANVPVGNLAVDVPSFLTDLFFARYLKRNQAVLWWSSSILPDLAGKECDEGRVLVDLDMSLPTYNHQAAHPAICFEIGIENLVANTLLNSHLINELEGSQHAFESAGLEANEANPNHDADPTRPDHDLTTNQMSSVMLEELANSHCGIKTELSFTGDPHSIHPFTFDLLKTLVRNWCTELVNDHCPHAEQMIKHLYRWVTCPTSHLYDPRLHHVISQLMHKLFAQLIAAVQATGAVVLHASPHKLVVGTNKISHANGEAFGTYLVNSILVQPRFRHLGLGITLTWDRILWMNPTNFAGILTQSQPYGEEELESDLPLSLVMSWAIANYLPPSLRVHFDAVLGKFLLDLHHHRQEYLTKVEDQSTRPTQAQIGWRDDETDFGQKVLVNDMLPRLLELVPDLQGARQVVDLQFPHLPGSPYYMHHRSSPSYQPVLEWVKSVCAAIGLDSRFEDEVALLKRNLLQALNVNIHSEQAVFHLKGHSKHQPSKSSANLSFPSVVCSHCNFSFEIDFYEHLQQHPPESLVSDSNSELTPDQLVPFHHLPCPSCSAPFPASQIEHQLVETLHRHVVASQLQDVTCSKCHLMQSTPMHQHCPSCTLPYQPVQYPPLHLEGFVQQLHALASLYTLPHLKATLNFLDQY